MFAIYEMAFVENKRQPLTTIAGIPRIKFMQGTNPPAPPTGGFGEASPPLRKATARQRRKEMTANNSPTVRVFRLMTSVADLVLRGKRDPDQVAKVFQLIKDNSDFAAQLLVKAKAKAKIKADSAVRLFVDYTRPLAEMIKGCGFDSVNPNITEKHYPVNKRSNAEVEMKAFSTEELVGTNRSVTSEEVIKSMMSEKGYRPAELPEGLAYAKANPDEQWKYPIVILGSVWRDFGGYRRVPCLDAWDGRRGLGLSWCGDWWDGGCRFLGVRK